MENFTATLTEDRLNKLKEVAAKCNIAPEELVRASVDELLARPEEEFQHTVDDVLNKNAELYKRLA
jgi:hypothetical protein